MNLPELALTVYDNRVEDEQKLKEGEIAEELQNEEGGAVEAEALRKTGEQVLKGESRTERAGEEGLGTDLEREKIYERPLWMRTEEEEAVVSRPLQEETGEAGEEEAKSGMEIQVSRKKGGGILRKLPFLVVGIILILLVFLAVKFLGNRDGGKGGAKVELNYWGLWEPNGVIDGLIAEFEQENPNIKVNYRMQQKDEYRIRLNNKLASTDVDAPDIFRIHVNWLPMFEDKIQMVPTETAKNLELDSAYFDVFKETLAKNGNFQAVPLMYDGLALYYNKDILSAGQKQVPKTWWGLRELARELTVKDETGKIRTAGVALGTTNNVDHWSDVLGLMLKQNGADPSDPKNGLVEDVLTFYTLFYSQDKVWDETLPSSTYYFGSGRLAFYFGPSWRVFNLREINPQLSMGIAGVPQLPKITTVSAAEAEKEGVELTNVNWASFWVEGVSKKSKHCKEAWQFLEFLAGKEGLAKMYAAASQIRDFGEIYPRRDLAEELMTDNLLGAFVSGADKATTWYLTDRTFDAGLNDQMIKYFEDAVNAMVEDGREAGGVIETLDAGVKQILDKYQI